MSFHTSLISIMIILILYFFLGSHEIHLNNYSCLFMFSTIISTYNYFVFLPCSYERSDAPSEVTRMLMDEPDELEEYVLSSRDK